MKIRRSARVVLLNDRDEVFMFRSGDLTRRDPITGMDRFSWVLPGGGLEAGETWEDAALREMWEETGIVGVPLGPCLWTREKAVNLPGEMVRGQERYYLVRCGNRTVTSANQLPHEQTHYDVHRWWSVEGIRASADIFYPLRLPDLLQPVIWGRVPPSPIHLREDDESAR